MISLNEMDAMGAQEFPLLLDIDAFGDHIHTHTVGNCPRTVCVSSH